MSLEDGVSTSTLSACQAKAGAPDHDRIKAHLLRCAVFCRSRIFRVASPRSRTCLGFTLIVDGADPRSEPFIDALFEAGCDDATVGLVDGVQYVDFD